MTVLLGCLLCHWLAALPSFVCPVVTNDPVDFIAGRKVLFEVQEQCALAETFQQRSLQVMVVLLSIN